MTKTKTLHYKNMMLPLYFGKVTRLLVNEVNPKSLPKNIKGYSLVRELKKSSVVGNYFSIGVYKNSQGKMAIAKMWSGRHINLPYLSIINEINSATIIQKTHEKNIDLIPKSITDIRTPRVIYSHISNDKVILLSEFAQGETLSKKPDSVKLSSLKKVLEYFEFIGKSMDRDSLRDMTYRRWYQELFLFPALFVKAVIINPDSILTIVKSSLKIAKSVKYFMRDTDIVLTHRDLHFENMILSRGKTVVIDLEFTVFTRRVSELSHTFISEWPNRFMIKNIYKIARDKGIDKKYLDAAICKSTVHFLSEKDIVLEKKEKYIGILKSII